MSPAELVFGYYAQSPERERHSALDAAYCYDQLVLRTDGALELAYWSAHADPFASDPRPGRGHPTRFRVLETTLPADRIALLRDAVQLADLPAVRSQYVHSAAGPHDQCYLFIEDVAGAGPGQAREVRAIGITAPFAVLLDALRDVVRATLELKSAKPREVAGLESMQRFQSDWTVDPSRPTIDEHGVRHGGTGL